MERTSPRERLLRLSLIVAIVCVAAVKLFGVDFGGFHVAEVVNPHGDARPVTAAPMHVKKVPTFAPRFKLPNLPPPTEEAHPRQPDPETARPTRTRAPAPPPVNAEAHGSVSGSGSGASSDAHFPPHVAAAAQGAIATKPLLLHHEWKNAPLVQITGENIQSLPKNGSMVCEFLLFGMPHVCRIEQGDEDMLGCVRRLGHASLTRALPSRCTSTEYWKSLAVLERPQDGADVGAGESKSETGMRDWVYMAQVSDGKPVPYVPPEQRTFRRDIESRQCSYGVLHPITFAIPYRNIVPRVTRHKFFDFLPYGMRKFPPWQYRPGAYRMGSQDEYLTSMLHKHSYFAFTHKRGGWDCMRHTEILAAGSVPYFADLAKCGKFCLVMLPKKLLREAMELPGVDFIGSIGGKPVNGEFIENVPRATANMNYKKTGRIDWAKFNETQYFDLADRMLRYTQQYSSTKSLVAYVLNKIGYEEPKHAFVLGRDHMDYLELMMESGFGDLGINYTANHVRPTWHQVPRVEPGVEYSAAELEKQRDKRGLKSAMHGASMVTGLRIPPLQFPTDDGEIKRKLRNGEIDLVVYTWPHWPVTGYPYWKEVSAALPRERIVFIDGGDDGADPHNDFRKVVKHGHIFRRELHEGQC